MPEQEDIMTEISEKPRLIDVRITSDYLIGSIMTDGGNKIAITNANPKEVKVIGKIFDGKRYYRFETPVINLE